MIKAFTIIELVVVLLLSAIIMLLGYSGYHSLAKQMNLYRENQNSIEHYYRLDYYLTNDMSRADSVSIENKNLTFYTQSGIQNNYTFDDEQVIISKENFRDTVPCAADMLNLSYDEDKKQYHFQYSSKRNTQELEHHYYSLKRLTF